MTDQPRQPWQVNTERLSQRVREAASESRTEEDLKMRVEPMLQDAFESLGIDVEIVRYEKATGLRGRTDALYGFLVLFGIGEYSVAPYRVTWARTTSRMAAVVLSKVKTGFGLKEVIGCDDTAFFPADDRNEAHYLCAVMNCSLVKEFLYAAKPTGHVAPPSAVKPLKIPRYKPSDRAHKKLAELSEEAHRRVSRSASIEEIDREIDALTEKLWTM